MKRGLLEILACPLCLGKLMYRQQPNEELICRFDKLAYPIRDSIPIMLIDQARQLKMDEL